MAPINVNKLRFRRPVMRRTLPQSLAHEHDGVSARLLGWLSRSRTCTSLVLQDFSAEQRTAEIMSYRKAIPRILGGREVLESVTAIS
jgi:hypothetical protein